jgi:hypothetical protein
VSSSPAERVALIAIDRELRIRQESEKENEEPMQEKQRRVSAATRARWDHRDRMAANMGEENKKRPKRKRGKSLTRPEDYHPAIVRQGSETNLSKYVVYLSIMTRCRLFIQYCKKHSQIITSRFFLCMYDSLSASRQSLGSLPTTTTTARRSLNYGLSSKAAMASSRSASNLSASSIPANSRKPWK